MELMVSAMLIDFEFSHNGVDDGCAGLCVGPLAVNQAFGDQ